MFLNVMFSTVANVTSNLAFSNTALYVPAVLVAYLIDVTLTAGLAPTSSNLPVNV